MKIEKLSGDFIRGYTKAIMDILNIWDYIHNDLKHHHKRMNYELTKELLKCVLNNREKVRENMNGFIRWNCVKHEFEWFEKEN